MSLNRREFTLGALGALSFTRLAQAGTAADLVMKRAIPSSGELIPVVGLGTNRYGVDTSAEARAPLLDALARFHAWGGGLIDTAPMYRTSEIVLGDLIAELDIMDDVFMATKTDEEDMSATEPQMRRSLERLKAAPVDLMQIHIQPWFRFYPR